jgi:outer membrane protein assembly factor BamB
VSADPPPTQTVSFTNRSAGQALVRFDTGQTLKEFTVADGSGPLAGASRAIPGDGGVLVATVSFEPDAVRNFSSAFTYTACNGTGVCIGARSISLNGIGANPQLAIVPNPISYSGVAPGAQATQSITVSNLGTNAVTVDCIRLGSLGNSRGSNACGAASDLFYIGASSVALPATLAPAGTAASSLTFPLTYTASGGTSDGDELDVDGTPVGATAIETARAPIVGDQSLGPCQLSVSPPTLNFGTVTVTAPVTKAVAFHNSGQSSCGLTGLAIDRSSSAAFGLVQGQPSAFSIPAGSTVAVAVVFQLSAAGGMSPSHGSLDFQSGDPSYPTGQVPLVAYLNPANPYAAGWPKWHFDNNNSGQTTSDTSGNAGNVLWTYPGLTSAVDLNAEGKGGSVCGGEAYVNSPVVLGDPTGAGPYSITQLSLDGTLYVLSADGGLLWKKKLSSPQGDPHPSTPAAPKDGSLWVISGSDGDGKQIYYFSPAGSVQYSAYYGEDGFDAAPGLGPDGTLYEADDDGQLGSGTDPYSAIAFSAAGGASVNLIAGLALPLTAESERFGIAIGNDSTSYWGNNGQFFAIAAAANGFGQLPAWPANGVTVVDNSGDENALGPVFSDLALDPNGTGYAFTYSSWEDGTPSNCRSSGRCQEGPPYTVQGLLAALSMADGSRRWSLRLPPSQLPAGWTPLCSDYGNAAPAVAADGTVYVGNSDGLRAVDGASGKLDWLFPSSNVSSSPAIGGDGTVFFGCGDGTFYAVNPDGSARFSLNLGAPISSSPAIAGDGTVIVTSDDGTVWAIQ